MFINFYPTIIQGKLPLPDLIVCPGDTLGPIAKPTTIG